MNIFTNYNDYVDFFKNFEGGNIINYDKSYSLNFFQGNNLNFQLDLQDIVYFADYDYVRVNWICNEDLVYTNTGYCYTKIYEMPKSGNPSVNFNTIDSPYPWYYDGEILTNSGYSGILYVKEPFLMETGYTYKFYYNVLSGYTAFAFGQIEGSFGDDVIPNSNLTGITGEGIVNLNELRSGWTGDTYFSITTVIETGTTTKIEEMKIVKIKDNSNTEIDFDIVEEGIIKFILPTAKSNNLVAGELKMNVNLIKNININRDLNLEIGQVFKSVSKKLI